MSQMPEPLQSRQNNFLPSAERFNPTDNQTFAHHVQTLHKLEAPISNIYLALSTERPVSNLIETFNTTVEQIDLWLVHANGAILALELDVREGMNVKSVGEMDILIHKFAPNVDDLLQELLQAISNNLKDADDEGKRKEIQGTFDRINADWVEVKAFFGRVKKEMSESKQRRELLDTMNHIITSIEELNTSIFEYQEQRLSGFGEGVGDTFSLPKLSSSPTTWNNRSITPAALSSLGNSSHNSDLSSRAESALRQLDSRLEPLAARIEYLRSRLSAPNAPSDPNGALAKKNSILSGKWDALRKEMETLREELKEDRWLGVFKQVTGNASHMMDSLERAVKQCKDFMTRTLKLLHQNRGMPIPSRYNQRTYSQQQQSLSQPPIAISPKNFQRLYKSFDAKRKYYVPAVIKMLTMLANGINQQMTKDFEAIKKYRSMKERWDNILDGVEEIQRDMPGLESLMEHAYMTSNSPPSSKPSSIGSSPPMSPNMRPSRGMFSPEPGSPPKGQRSLSPYGIMSPLEHHEASVSPSRNNARSPSLRSKSPSPRAMSPLGGRNHLTPNGRRAESPPSHYERQQWNAQYNNSLYNNSHYNQSYNNHNSSHYRERAISPQPRSGRTSSRPDSPVRSSSNRLISPERPSASAIPRPVTSMGIINRASSRAGIRSLLPKPSTPQPGMASMYRSGMVSPPPMMRRVPVRSPTPSSQTSSPSRPITPETEDRPTTPISQTLAKINSRSDKYVPVKSDPLDVEVAKIVNASPIHVKVERAPGGGGRYFFGNGEPGRERKVHNVKLTSYGNKVMVRVGGGWTDLDMFLLDHSLMASVRNI